MRSQDNEYFFEHNKDAITTLRLGRQRPDSRKIPKHVQPFQTILYKSRPELYRSSFTGDAKE